MPAIAEILDFLQTFAPLDAAAEWDNVGLLLGDASQPAERIMTCLTVTEAVVAEAVAAGVQLLVSHHPILFRGAKKLSTATPDGRIVWPLARAGIAVYSPHTAFDNGPGGINDTLAQAVGLTQLAPLRTRPGPTQSFKLVVFVPETDRERVAEAIFSAGGGVIGQYEQCSFRIPGTGTFFGTDSANPSIGVKGKLEEVSEHRLEVLVPAARIDAAIAAMRKAHSYEVPAFDVYPLRPGTVAEGRVGTLEKPSSLREFAGRVREATGATHLQMVGDPERRISRVGVACGAAGEFLTDALRERCDAFVTGEVRFHDGIRAADAGIALVLPGHYATERPAVEMLAERLRQRFPEVAAFASTRDTDPFA